MANTLVSGWKPGPQTNHEYRPDHEQHLELLSHLHDFKKFLSETFSSSLQPESACGGCEDPLGFTGDGD